MALLANVLLFCSMPAVAQTSKDRWRCQHVVKGIKMSSDLQTRFNPVFYAYLKEMHQAGDIYDNLKEKYQTQIDKRQLTNEQAQQLMDAHWTSDAKQVQIKQKYTDLFCKIIKAPYVYEVFRLANDKQK